MVERRGELVPRQDLMSAVWPDTFVEESNLSSNISILRRYLGAAPDGGNYIQTIPKRGYRFAAAVKLVQDEPPVPLTGEDVPRGVSPTVEPESDGAGQAAGPKEAGTGGTTATESKNKRAVPQGTILVAAAVLLGLVLALAYRQVWRWRMPGSVATMPGRSGAPFAAGCTTGLAVSWRQPEIVVTASLSPASGMIFRRVLFAGVSHSDSASPLPKSSTLLVSHIEVSLGSSSLSKVNRLICCESGEM
jgi:hypothetical protein